MPISNPPVMAPGLIIAKSTINWNDVSPVTVVIVPVGSHIIAVVAEVTTVWAGVGQTVDIGDAADPDGFIASGNLTLANLGWKPTFGGGGWGVYLGAACTQPRQCLAATPVLVAIGGAPTQGVIDVYVLFSDPGVA